MLVGHLQRPLNPQTAALEETPESCSFTSRPADGALQQSMAAAETWPTSQSACPFSGIIVRIFPVEKVWKRTDLRMDRLIRPQLPSNG
ncbi:hypothetical protein GJAV_G00050050 [Gymnothorax javanicus]|nr:hypothetical protein GJAV_G00050050 [Gymnothorax javanicus]